MYISFAVDPAMQLVNLILKVKNCSLFVNTNLFVTIYFSQVNSSPLQNM